jgi:hypothetical protein
MIPAFKYFQTLRLTADGNFLSSVRRTEDKVLYFLKEASAKARKQRRHNLWHSDMSEDLVDSIVLLSRSLFKLQMAVVCQG